MARDPQAPCFNNPAFSELVCCTPEVLLIAKPHSHVFHVDDRSMSANMTVPILLLSDAWL